MQKLENVVIMSLDEYEGLVGKEQSKELEVGEWYVIEEHEELNALIFNIDNIKGFGFSLYSRWADSFNTSNVIHFEQSYRKATPQEVDKALIEEAKRRYKVGFVIRSMGGSDVVIGDEIEFTYLSVKNILNISYNVNDKRGLVTVFKDGKWAEVIEVDKFAELKEAHKNGAVIQFKRSDGFWNDLINPVWHIHREYRIKPTPKAIGVRTDCLIMGEVTEQTETTISINNLRFLKDQVTFLSEEEYREIRKVYD